MRMSCPKYIFVSEDVPLLVFLLRLSFLFMFCNSCRGVCNLVPSVWERGWDVCSSAGLCISFELRLDEQ